MQKSKLKILEWEDAKDIKKEVEIIVGILNLDYVQTSRIFCYRTVNSKARAYARIWQFPKIFQRALKIKPAYVIEVLSKHFDKLDKDNKNKVLIHELMHIPKNFSGALIPHNVNGRRITVLTNKLFKEYKEKNK